MIGRKSIITRIALQETKNGFMEITLQANKNWGICDMRPYIPELMNKLRGVQINSPKVNEIIYDYIY